MNVEMDVYKFIKEEIPVLLTAQLENYWVNDPIGCRIFLGLSWEEAHMEVSMNLYEIFQDLYESEINFSISVFWDGGYDVALGDAINGIKANDTRKNIMDAAIFLKQQAIIHFPDSDFANKYTPPTCVKCGAHRTEGIELHGFPSGWFCSNCLKNPECVN